MRAMQCAAQQQSCHIARIVSTIENPSPSITMRPYESTLSPLPNLPLSLLYFSTSCKV